jgi:hypothetical protein
VKTCTPKAAARLVGEASEGADGSACSMGGDCYQESVAFVYPTLRPSAAWNAAGRLENAVRKRQFFSHG